MNVANGMCYWCDVFVISLQALLQNFGMPDQAISWTSYIQVLSVPFVALVIASFVS